MGCLKHAHQYGGFLDGQFTGGLTEKAPRSHFDAVGVLAEELRVEVELEDLVLGEFLLERHRDDRLARLAADGALGALLEALAEQHPDLR